MATNLPQIVSGSSSTPLIGQPFNFHGILDSILVPRVVASDSALSPGARLLWGIIRQLAFEDGRCFASDETLADAVAVSDRQCRRYCRQLETAGLLRTTPRPGKTPVRELLWDARFAGKIRPRADTSVRGGGQIRPGGRTLPSGVYKEEGVLKGVPKGKEAPIEKVVANAAPSLPARRRPPVRTDEEIIRRGREYNWPEHVIQRDLERARAGRTIEESAPVATPSYLENESDPSIPR